mgnify:CR=1 FL=1
MKIVVFESDIPSYHSVRKILESCDTEYEVIGPFTTTEQGRDYLMQHKDIDIIVTEVMLSDGPVFAALDQAPRQVPVIFATSYEEYALRAFDYLSLSYLLKPVDEETLSKALALAIRLRKAASLLTPKGGWNKSKAHLTRFVVKTLHGERVIHLSTVRYIVSEQKNTYLKLLDGNSYRVDDTLDNIAAKLQHSRFMRVNRKYILPVEQVSSTENIEYGKMLIHLKGDNAPKIVVSRTRKVEVCKWIKG